MVQYQLTEIQRKQVTWPLDVIFEGNEFAGYIMPRLYSAEDFTVVCGADITAVNLEDRLFIAYNICAAVDTVHSFGQVCGDLNPQNICVNLDASSETGLLVTLVDTDSYHIVNGKMMYRCEVGQANYLPPELQNRLYQGESLSTMALPTYSKETDRFALAVHLFSLFMNGCHPFACALDMSEIAELDDSVEIPQPSENIREGFIPFIQKRQGITYPAYAPDFTSLPESFQKLFIRTFVDGHANPSVRVSAREWMQAIMEVLQNKGYIKCPQGHIYFIHKMECPYCDMGRRNQHLREQVTPPPVIKEPESVEETPPAQVPLEQSPAGWQSSGSKGHKSVSREKAETQMPQPKEEFHLLDFLEEHVIHIVYGILLLFIVLFVVWYMGA
jgi:DNA-binding helix-hairpin-helix protein with protein kinase domain